MSVSRLVYQVCIHVYIYVRTWNDYSIHMNTYIVWFAWKKVCTEQTKQTAGSSFRLVGPYVYVVCTQKMSPSTDDTSLDSQNIIASVSVPNLRDNTACMVHVRWSEPSVSCGGSVSHYMLSVTPAHF